MHSVTLRGTSVHTSRLGFGTAGLMRATSTKARLNVLAAALDCGIRHFDTAPIYGLGEVEKLLGIFLSGRRENITLTTKFGLALKSTTSPLRFVQSAARAVLRAVPALRRMAQRRSRSLYEQANFTAAAARNTLESSLRLLQRDQVACYLMHECTAHALSDPSLLDTLYRLRDEGKIQSFGSASPWMHTAPLLRSHPQYCPVIQFEHPAVTDIARQVSDHHAIITHSALTGAFSKIARDDAVRARWGKSLDMDLHSTHALAALFVRSALATNPGGIVLIHSNSVQHVLHNAAASSQPMDQDQLQRMRRLIAALAP